MSTSPSVETIISELAARNIRWERTRDRIEAALAAEQSGHRPECHLGPYVTVARDHGSGGGELAAHVGAALGWPVLDHEIVDLVAAHLHVNPSMLNLLEHDAAGWVTDVLGDVLPYTVISRDAYTLELRRVVQLLALHGEVVLLARGAGFFLPHECGLSVRVVAARENRIARVSARTGKDREAALAEIKDADRAQAHFVSHAFGCDISDPLYYDLVVNSSRVPLPKLAELVAGVCRARCTATPAAHPGS